MEEKNKKLFSTILMTVGALFIVISGGIFVSQTWHYLPEAVKKLCLAAVTAAFFAGAWYTEKKSGLKKTPALLYYLGVCFTGFSVMSLLAFDSMEFYERFSVAILAMSIPVTMRFLRERKAADFIFQAILADAMVLCVSQYPLKNPEGVTTISVCLVTMLLAGFVYYCKEKMSEDRGLNLSARILCWTHMALSFPGILGTIFSETNFFFSVLPMLMLTASLTVIYLSNKCRIYRILQSVGILLCSMAVTSFAGHYLETALGRGLVEAEIFAAFLIDLALMIWLNRAEMAAVCGGLASFLSLIQILNYADNYYLETQNGVFYPFAICMAAGLLLWKYFRRPDKSWKKYLMLSATWLVLGLHTLSAWGFEKYCNHYGGCFWLSIVLVQISVLAGKHINVRDIFRSAAVLIMLGGLAANEIFPTVIRSADKERVLADFGTEYGCILMALGIVLLGKIWYDRSKVVSMLQFIGTCILLFVLVCSNLCNAQLPNVLFFGIAALILLIAACMLHRRDYAIASAVTLIMVVLYLTRTVWMSIAWWVYLFAAGVGLVVYAIKREKAE